MHLYLKIKCRGISHCIPHSGMVKYFAQVSQFVTGSGPENNSIHTLNEYNCFLGNPHSNTVSYWPSTVKITRLFLCALFSHTLHLAFWT